MGRCIDVGVRPQYIIFGIQI